MRSELITACSGPSAATCCYNKLTGPEGAGLLFVRADDDLDPIHVRMRRERSAVHSHTSLCGSVHRWETANEIHRRPYRLRRVSFGS